jgi:hypothetical protein
MKRKRAPGGGRKPKGEFSQLTSSLTIRIPDDMRKQLESEAAIGGHSVAQTLLWHLRQSFDRKRAKERDPALAGLILLIDSLAGRLSGSDALVRSLDNSEAGKAARSELQALWRINSFRFRAFKFAVGKLLAALEEPPDEGLDPITKKRLKEWEKFPVTKPALEAHKSPEALGAWVFAGLWEGAHRTAPLSEAEREVFRKYPLIGELIERNFYALPKALKALELKPKTTKPKDESR